MKSQIKSWNIIYLIIIISITCVIDGEEIHISFATPLLTWLQQCVEKNLEYYTYRPCPCVILMNFGNMNISLHDADEMYHVVTRKPDYEIPTSTCMIATDYKIERE